MQTPLSYHLLHRLIIVLVVLAGTFQYTIGAEANVPTQLLLEPGSVARIAITGSLPQGGDVAITIRYNPSVMQIIGARGSETYAIRCAEPQRSEPVIESSTRAYVTIRCAFSVGVTNDTLVALDVQGVLGTGSIGALGVDSIAINDVPVLDLAANECEVRRGGGSRGGFTITQGITGTYPNPFRDRTRVVFVMRAPGTVSCALRTYQGRIVTSVAPMEATAGENAIDLNVIAWEIAAGAYVVTITTDEGTFYHPVTVMK